jgi:hypothetical protein
MVLATIPAAVALLGLLILGYAGPKTAKVGEICFFCGLLATLLFLGHKGTITLFP